MNTDTQLIEYAKRLHIPLRFIGNKDKLAGFPLQNGAYIVNLQDDVNSNGEDQSGTHWVAFWIEKGKAVYFNSFGIAPPAEIQLYLYRFRPYMYNENQIQNTASGWCGIYVLSFLQSMKSHPDVDLKKRFEKFLYRFSENPRDNLGILKNIMGHRYFRS